MIVNVKKLVKVSTLIMCLLLLYGCGSDKDEADYYEPADEEYDEDYYDEYEDQDYYDSDQQDDEEPAEQFEEGSSGYAIGMMDKVFSEYQAQVQADPVRQQEVTPEEKMISFYDDSGKVVNESVDVCSIEMDGRTMQYTMDIIGDPGENGLYPLYITLHGGGGGAPEENNEQWLAMRGYYSSAVESGIYVATRGMEDTWNTHFLDYSYEYYDRLIEDMIMLKDADPDRVFLLGFSAGGDGVYAIAPRMADRFAAVNMSSGHPNGVSLLNTSNLPFEIQVGIRDFYSEDALRSIRGAEFEDTLNGYNSKFGFGYPHRVLVHVPEGHNYNDYEDPDDEYNRTAVLKDPAEFAGRAVTEDWLGQFLDLYSAMGYGEDVTDLSYSGYEDYNQELTDYIENSLNMEVDYEANSNAVRYVNSFTRKASPEKFVWDLSTRAPVRKDTAFYWLKADHSVNSGLIYASYDENSNTVTLRTDGNVSGDIYILATPMLMDFSRPLKVVTPEGEFSADLEADEQTIRDSLSETGDAFLSWADEVKVIF